MKKKWRKETKFFVKLNQELIDNLKDQDATLETVLPSDRKVNLHTVANFGQGALSMDRTDDIHPSFVRAFETLYSRGRMVQLGLDLICEDISKDMNEQTYAVLEVNDRPGIRCHHYPAYGKSRNIARAIFGAVFPELASNPTYWANGGPAPSPAQSRTQEERASSTSE